MLLVIDIGNSNIVAGLFAGPDAGAPPVHWRVSTASAVTTDEFAVLLAGLFSARGISETDVKATVICSVVPQACRNVAGALRGLTRTEPLVISSGKDAGMPMRVDNPTEVGADRVVNTVAAYHLFEAPAVVVDFGTAVTFDLVNANGEFCGGVIAPGPATVADALNARAPELPRVGIERPERVVGTNTVAAMRSGLYHGFVSLVDGVLSRMIEEAGPVQDVIATGGAASVFAGACSRITATDEFLTLKGLRIIHEGNR